MYGENVNLNSFIGGVNLSEIKTLLDEKDSKDWKINVEKYPKLRSYRTFKTEFGKEPYVENFLSKNRRSTVAQIRTGTSFLRIETGRYERQVSENGNFEKLPVEKRICRICESGEVEDELHFMLKCNSYCQPRAILRFHLEKKGVVFDDSATFMGRLLSEKSLLSITADFIQYALEIRKATENK